MSDKLHVCTCSLLVRANKLLSRNCWLVWSHHVNVTVHGLMYSLWNNDTLPLNPVQLFDVVARYDTLRNVINSVTRNLKSILLTAILALILIFLYSIFGYIFFPGDFLLPTNPRDVLQTCTGESTCTCIHVHVLSLSSPVYQVEMICLALFCICIGNSAHIN